MFSGGLFMEKLSRKDRERLRKQEDIINIAERLFAKNGFEATTMDDIAKEAEFAKGTLYKYFESKDALFFSLFSNKANELFDALEQKIQKDKEVQTIINELVHIQLKYFEENKEFLKIISSEQSKLGLSVQSDNRQDIMTKYLQHSKIFKKVFTRGIAEGVFKNKDYDAQTLALSLTGLMNAFSFQWMLEEVNSKKPISLTEKTSTIISIFMKGATK
jgi:AcrR family transcriptional regulator